MNQIFFHHLLVTQRAHWDRTRQGFKKLGLSESMPKILYLLNWHEGVMQKELAGICQLKESTMTVTLQHMQKMGFVNKVPYALPTGKRAYAIYLTDAGREKSREVVELMGEVDAQALAGFTEEEQEMVFSFFDRICKNLRDENAEEENE